MTSRIPIYPDTDREFYSRTGELRLLRCAICGGPTDSHAYETGSLGARYCSFDCVVIAKACGIYGKSRIIISHLREADSLIEAWEERLKDRASLGRMME